MTIPTCGGKSTLNYFQILTSFIGQLPTNKYATFVAYLFSFSSRLLGNQGTFAVRKHIKTAGVIIDKVRHDIAG